MSGRKKKINPYRPRNKRDIHNNKEYRAYLCDCGQWSCQICPPWKGENETGLRKDKRSWKRHRKTKFRKIAEM